MIKFQVLSAALGSHMVAVGQKSQVRVSKEIKRTICKVSSVSRKKRRNYFVNERGTIDNCLGMSPSSSTRPLFWRNYKRPEKREKDLCQTFTELGALDYLLSTKELLGVKETEIPLNYGAAVHNAYTGFSFRFWFFQGIWKWQFHSITKK